MKFRISKEKFLEGLQQVQNVVSSRATLPILSNVLLEVDGGELRMTTTDLDVVVSGKVTVDEVESGGSTTLPVRRLATTGWCPEEVSWSTTREPRSPRPPVTTMRMVQDWLVSSVRRNDRAETLAAVSVRRPETGLRRKGESGCRSSARPVTAAGAAPRIADGTPQCPRRPAPRRAWPPRPEGTSS